MSTEHPSSPCALGPHTHHAPPSSPRGVSGDPSIVPWGAHRVTASGSPALGRTAGASLTSSTALSLPPPGHRVLQSLGSTQGPLGRTRQPLGTQDIGPEEPELAGPPLPQNSWGGCWGPAALQGRVMGVQGFGPAHPRVNHPITSALFHMAPAQSPASHRPPRAEAPAGCRKAQRGQSHYRRWPCTTISTPRRKHMWLHISRTRAGPIACRDVCPSPTLPRHPVSWGWSRAGHGHHATGQAGVSPLTIPAPAGPRVPAPGHRSPAPSTVLLQPGGGRGGRLVKMNQQVAQLLDLQELLAWLRASWGRVKLQGWETAGKFLPGRVTVSLPGDVEAEPEEWEGKGPRASPGPVARWRGGGARGTQSPRNLPYLACPLQPPSLWPPGLGLGETPAPQPAHSPLSHTGLEGTPRADQGCSKTRIGQEGWQEGSPHRQVTGRTESRGHHCHSPSGAMVIPPPSSHFPPPCSSPGTS